MQQKEAIAIIEALPSIIVQGLFRALPFLNIPVLGWLIRFTLEAVAKRAAPHISHYFAKLHIQYERKKDQEKYQRALDEYLKDDTKKEKFKKRFVDITSFNSKLLDN